jgi:hypothetical protein
MVAQPSAVNSTKLLRSKHRDMGLQLRHKTPKRRGKAKLREDRRPTARSNETWAMDFVHDQLATETKLRVLTIIDTFSRFSPAMEPRFHFRGADVVEVPERVGREEFGWTRQSSDRVSSTDQRPALIESWLEKAQQSGPKNGSGSKGQIAQPITGGKSGSSTQSPSLSYLNEE